ncbi:MAG: HAD-IIA family hydrolase [candidate division KSB1 bacterium]|nr:HAD-IIA family hydrolase [candidate division KSB1 bacterium]
MSPSPACNIPLFTACRAVVCDLDGTLYLEDGPIFGAQQFLKQVLARGKQLYYFTNNDSISREGWLNKLRELDFPIESRQLIMASDCAEAYLKRNGWYPEIYLIGNTDLRRDFSDRGFRCLDESEALQGQAKAVVLAFDTELNYEKITVGYELLMRGLPYVATHGDLLCPVTKNRFKPDIGTFISLFETACGRKPILVGKPTAEAARVIAEKAQLPYKRIAFIGDRLYTDMQMATDTGMVSVLVLSGETTEAMLAASHLRPHLIAASVNDLTDFL